jgi:hypothetical protein
VTRRGEATPWEPASEGGQALKGRKKPLPRRIVLAPLQGLPLRDIHSQGVALGCNISALQAEEQTPPRRASGQSNTLLCLPRFGRQPIPRNPGNRATVPVHARFSGKRAPTRTRCQRGRERVGIRAVSKCASGTGTPFAWRVVGGLQSSSGVSAYAQRAAAWKMVEPRALKKTKNGRRRPS